MAAFPIAFIETLPFGVLAGVTLPAEANVENDSAVDHALLRLTADEQRLAAAENNRRRLEFIGGRLAFAAALDQLGVARSSLTVGDRGAPMCDAPFSVSISHKRDLAVALVAPRAHGTIGIDLEGGGREPLAIASRVLRTEELSRFESLSAADQWPHLLRMFAIKEATYKAIFPHVKRYVGFHEASADVDPPRAEFHPAEGDPALALEVDLRPCLGRVLAVVRARPV